MFGYVSGGCETDASLRGNRSAFASYGSSPACCRAWRGQAGVRHAIGILAQEIQHNMALLGIDRLDQVREQCVVRLHVPPSAR